MGDGCYDVSSASEMKALAAGRQPPAVSPLCRVGYLRGRKLHLVQSHISFRGSHVLVTDQCKGIEAHALVPIQPAPEAHPSSRASHGLAELFVRTTSQLKSPSAQSPLFPLPSPGAKPKTPTPTFTKILPSSI